MGGEDGKMKEKSKNKKEGKAVKCSIKRGKI
jgi:hypothetical protein